MTYYLRFPSEQIAISCFVAAQMADENASIILCTHDYAIDIIGTITEGGEYGEDGEVIKEPQVVEGWHVNFKGELPEEWKPFCVEPATPVRVFL